MSRSAITIALTVLFGPPLAAAEPVDYARDIKPLLRQRCYACHGALKQKAKLRVDTVALMKAGGKHGPAIQASDPAGSLLVERVCETDDSLRMPPEGKPLTAAQVALLKTWIEQGAKGPADEKPEADPRDHWAFHAPKRGEIPKTKNQISTNPIDAFLSTEWEKRGLKPVGETDRATLLRRVYLDLIGLPPTRDELHAFLADTSPDAYEKVVDKLLASPRYGERWARHWMDVWRYSDWYGRRAVPDVLNSYGQIWRWRDWIVRSVNGDRAYDDMVRMMLAADELAPESDADSVATGFVVRNFYRWNYNNWMRDNVEHTAKAFLGLTLNCCHCHDHKYDPITQEEYFRFRAVFEPIEVRHDRWPGEPGPGVYPKYSYGASYKPIASGMVRVMDEKLAAKTSFYTGGDERNVVKDRTVTPGVPASLGGTFKVEPVTLPPQSWYPGLKPFVRQEETTKREAAVKAVTAALTKAMIAGDVPGTRVVDAKLIAAKSDLAALLARIAADDVTYLGVRGDPKALAAAAGKAEKQAAFDAAWLVQVQAEVAVAATKNAKNTAEVGAAEKQLADAKAKLEAARKALQAPATTYTPLSAVYPKTSTGRRSALAKWIASRDNPLTARVAVNHLWGWHFGRSLVETTNNFGRSGKAPTHPELLDWLAVEFMDMGWHIKPLHRLIVTSRAYRMSSKLPTADTPNLKADPDNLYLWRFPTNRLEAEVVRDSLLSVAGDLDLTVGGVDIPQDQGLTSRRRSLYLTHHGEARVQFLDLFDAANPCDAYRRTSSVLPQQALALANSDLSLRLSRVLAGNLSPAKSDQDFVRAAFEQVLSRPPREAEVIASVKFLESQRALFEASAAELKADPKQPAGPSTDPAQRARENLVLALFNHTDFVTVR
jgi:hypothetical protein